MRLYREEFRILSDSAYRISQGARVPYPQTYAILLKNLCKKVPKRNSFSISRKDIEQQLELIWLEARLSHRKVKSKASLRSYFVRCGVFGLRDYLWREFKLASTIPWDLDTDQGYREGRELSLVWLLKGTKEKPWSILSAYERYLLYLRFGCDLTTREMTVILKTYRVKIRSRLNKIIQKLRRALNETQYSGRYCKG